MNITISAPTLASVGMADDADPATGQACNYFGAGSGRCNDGAAISSANPTASTSINVTVQPIVGPNPAPGKTPKAKAKGEANSSVTITYSWWEKIVSWVGVWQSLSAEVHIHSVAFVNVGPNQVAFAVHLTGGPVPGPGPIPLFQGSYNFDQSPNDPTRLDVKKNGALDKSIGNPGLYLDLNAGPTVVIRPGTYKLKFEMNAAAEADGQVFLFADGNLRLF